MARTSQDRSSKCDIELMDDEFTAYVESLLQEYHVPGISIAIVDNGKVSAKVRRLLNVPL
jgi:CubicO group peptidase (beta-lactamase class C family)